ncbi:DUF4352 domain-containing protein [Gottfriedia sp. NPDC057991]|uniref:DUF4352 domain-containing protein n=1 Tax=Gottfriedia sp. NPDC057991 TaxID=3346298 RepID=UPI0036D9A8D9
MKIKAGILLMASILTFLTGCMSGNVEKQKNLKKINGLEITLDEIKEYKKRENIEVDPPDKVYQVQVNVKNNSSNERGVGSLDFKAVDKKGKEMIRYGYADSIGEVIGIGKSIHGNIYFVGKIEDISYIEFKDPNTSKLNKWKIKEMIVY